MIRPPESRAESLCGFERWREGVAAEMGHWRSIPRAPSLGHMSNSASTAHKDPRIAIERAGSGPPIVLTHGFGDSATTWDPLHPLLETDFETVRWDMLGHGRSAKPTREQDYSLAGGLADLDAVIDAAIEPTTGGVVLVGHSLGGYLAQYRAATNLGRIRALVLIATGPGFRSVDNREKWNTFVRKSAENFDVPIASVGLAEQHDDFVMANLERLTVPVLQIVGERDTQYHAALEVLKRRVPDIETMIVPGAGHHVHRSHSADVGKRILSFLERVS